MSAPPLPLVRVRGWGDTDLFSVHFRYLASLGQECLIHFFFGQTAFDLSPSRRYTELRPSFSDLSDYKGSLAQVEILGLF